ncbi:MAG: Uma2 family endonuclease [Bryobacteraceae bacterium]
MASQPLNQLSPAAYLELERAAEQKHEFVEGEMVAMAGGSLAHALIMMNIGADLWQKLQGKHCFVFSSDARVCVHWDRLITYPDVTVVCGQPEHLDEKRDTITNPTVLVEVLSPSTMNFDRGEKARQYRGVSSLKEFLLVDQAPVDIEHYKRLPDGTWQIIRITAPDSRVRLESIDCELEAAVIYRGVNALTGPAPPQN